MFHWFLMLIFYAFVAITESKEQLLFCDTCIKAYVFVHIYKYIYIYTYTYVYMYTFIFLYVCKVFFLKF